MSGQSNVGEPSVYEADDQRASKEDYAEEKKRFEEGKENSHLALDHKDERTIANKLAAEEQKEKEKDAPKSLDDALREKDARAPALAKGNKPSRGAEIDQEIREEEEAILKKKGAWNPQ